VMARRLRCRGMWAQCRICNATFHSKMLRWPPICPECIDTTLESLEGRWRPRAVLRRWWRGLREFQHWELVIFWIIVVLIVLLEHLLQTV